MISASSLTMEAKGNMSSYKPPFTMTDDITMLVSVISEEIGRLSALQEGNITPHQRRTNRIRTIHASLAIENNTLTIDQVTAIIDGKRILGNPNEIREVRNAYEAYELILELDPLYDSIHSLWFSVCRIMLPQWSCISG